MCWSKWPGYSRVCRVNTVSHMEHLYSSETEERGAGRCQSALISQAKGTANFHIQEFRRRMHTNTVKRTKQFSFETNLPEQLVLPQRSTLTSQVQRHSGTSSPVSYFNKSKNVLLLCVETVLKHKKRRWWGAPPLERGAG